MDRLVEPEQHDLFIGKHVPGQTRSRDGRRVLDGRVGDPGAPGTTMRPVSSSVVTGGARVGDRSYFVEPMIA
jgi:hypothetical protein